MRMNVEYEEGDLRRLVKLLDDLPEGFGDAVYPKGFRAMASTVAREARRSRVFEDKTGLLRSRIRVESISDTYQGKRKRNWGAQVVVRVPHAYLVERGHGGKVAEPHPFLEDALEKTANRQLARAASTMRKAFARFADKLNARSRRR